VGYAIALVPQEIAVLSVNGWILVGEGQDAAFVTINRRFGMIEVLHPDRSWLIQDAIVALVNVLFDECLPY
jgi:hypothetical protein